MVMATVASSADAVMNGHRARADTKVSLRRCLNMESLVLLEKRLWTEAFNGAAPQDAANLAIFLYKRGMHSLFAHFP